MPLLLLLLLLLPRQCSNEMSLLFAAQLLLICTSSPAVRHGDEDRRSVSTRMCAATHRHTVSCLVHRIKGQPPSDLPTSARNYPTVPATSVESHQFPFPTEPPIPGGASIGSQLIGRPILSHESPPPGLAPG